MIKKGMKMLLVTAILSISVVTIFYGEVKAQDVLKISNPDNVYRHNYDPNIATDSSGDSYVVWHGSDGYNWEVYWVKVDADGTPGTVEMISTHPDNVGKQDWGPKIGIDSSGNSYVVWRGYDGFDNEIYWVKVDAGGTPGTVQKISTHPDNVTQDDWTPQVAADASGNSYVVWHGSDGNDNEIYWVKVDAGGTPGTVQKISTHPDNVTQDDWTPQVAADASGNSYVVWHGSDGNDNEIYWVKVDAGGTPGTVQKISLHADNVNEDDLYPQIVVASSNSYVVWQGQDGYNWNVYWVRVDAQGNPGTVQKVSTHADNATYDEWFPQIAVESGDSYVTYQGYDGNDNEIYWVKVDAQDAPTAVQKISTHADNANGYDFVPQIAVESGDSYVTYQGWDGRDDEIYWVKVDTEGTVGTAEKISTHADNDTKDDWKPQITTHAGTSYVVYQGWDGGDFEIYFVSIAGVTDSDNDGIPDELDACPFENPEGLDANLDGCTDTVCDLAEIVQSLGIHHGIENSLVQKANNSCAQFRRGKLNAAVNLLDAFINSVEAQRNKKISEEDADLLIQFARNAQLAILGGSGGDGTGAGTGTPDNELTENVSPTQNNNQMRPLAQHNMGEAQELSDHVEDLLSQAEAQGIDTSDVEELLEGAEKLLVKAQELFIEGNYTASNTCSMDAIEAFGEIIAVLEGLLS